MNFISSYNTYNWQTFSDDDLVIIVKITDFKHWIKIFNRLLKLS